jgi:hypothetical protein
MFGQVAITSSAITSCIFSGTNKFALCPDFVYLQLL